MDKVKDLIKKGLILVWDFVSSKDMKALYWYSFAQFVSASGDILVQSLTTWNPDNIITVMIGLVLSRITKRLNT